MTRIIDYRDCSRSTLEAFEAGLLRDIAAGRTDLFSKLETVQARIPHAPLYDIDYRRN